MRSFLISVWHDRFRIVAIAASVMAMAVVVSLARPPTYVTSSTLLVLASDAYGNQPVALSTQAAAAPMVMEREAILNAELSILTSPSIVREVVRTLSPQGIYPGAERVGMLGGLLARLGMRQPTDPEQVATDRVLQSLAAVSDKRGGTLTVSFSHGDPVIGAKVLDQLLQAFQKRRASLYLNAQSELIALKVADAKSRLEAAERALAGYQADSGISDYQVQMELLLRRLSDLERAEQAARTELGEAAQRVATLKSQLRTTPDSVVQYSDAESDRRAQAARDSLSDLRRQRAQLLETFTEKSQKVTVVQGQIEALEKELSSLLATPAPSSVRRGLNEVRTSVELALLRAQGESVSLEQRRRELASQVADVRAQVTALQDKHAGFESLVRQKALTEQAYLTSTKSLQERASIEEIESKRVANVRVLTPPEPARAPTRSRLAIIAAGILLGALSAAIVALLGHRFRRSFIDPERLAADLGLPVLACIDERRPASGGAI
jgi:uncharacterized protein involved in exopolysaccharide biosynthesis